MPKTYNVVLVLCTWTNLKEDIFQKVAALKSRNFNFSKTDKTNGDVTLHWMDGGIQPERPSELEPNEILEMVAMELYL
jgi:hypothetical protein